MISKETINRSFYADVAVFSEGGGRQVAVVFVLGVCLLVGVCLYVCVCVITLGLCCLLLSGRYSDGCPLFLPVLHDCTMSSRR